MSVNALSAEQLSLMCRHVDEAVSAGVSFNVAIRSLEIALDAFAKHRVYGNTSPLSANQIPEEQWSVAAKADRQMHPDRPFGEYLRVEHGTPRRALANLVLDLNRTVGLTTENLNALVDARWKIAVITLDEDRLLERSALHPIPGARRASAGIKFE